MSKVVTSKNIDGITDLVVVAPIKQGFIQAYENVTFPTRLRIVAEALNRVRVAAREHEKMVPYSDVAERILSLLDFRIGVVDEDLFALPTERERRENEEKGDESGKTPLRTRRLLYLTATFDGAWEPYMRLIWDPLGPFLDLLFCNCEGYVTAAEHSFDEFAQWVRDHQMDSAIFYATTGVTIRDDLYLSRLDQVHRSRTPAEGDREIARMTMPDPEAAAKAERDKALRDLAHGDRTQYRKSHELALEALTVLYRLADYYPPEWQVSQLGLAEGHFLARATESLLGGWDDILPQPPYPPEWLVVESVYADPLRWFRTGRQNLRRLDALRESKQPKDPVFRESEIQGGMLKAQGSRIKPMRQGALLLMTIVDAKKARTFIKKRLAQKEIHFAAGQGETPADGFFRTIALTADGLRRIGLDTDIIDWFPKEFREGMEMRSGLIGDMRENHPREWVLPQRNWPESPAAKARPPVEMSEVDIVIQIRTWSNSRRKLRDEIRRLAGKAAPGVTLQAYELMNSGYQPNGSLVDYFGFRDGISQPRPTPGLAGEPRKGDQVRLGELLLGYRNDRSDFAPADFTPVDPQHPTSYETWRIGERKKALACQLNGSFLVIRKLEQEVEAFERFIAAETTRINRDHPRLSPSMTEERLKARMLGRYPDGTPLIPTSDGSLNNFHYDGDREGARCPFASHIRRTNPRSAFVGRRTARMVRRGMSFDHRNGAGGAGGRGLVFMGYNASIAEQYETVQRWINGGNSTFVASGHNDPIMGVAPKTGALHGAERVFRFVEGDEVIRVTMPMPFVSLHWGLYLFVPSRTALRELCKLKGRYHPLRETLESQGKAVIDRLELIGDDQEERREWKRLLEDFDAKDPAERDISPDMWAAIRFYKGGSIRIPGVPRSAPPLAPPGANADSPWCKPFDNADTQPTILAASRKHVMQVLSDWPTFSTEEQLRRIEGNSGPIYVTQQPGDKYECKEREKGGYDYRMESEATNQILMDYTAEKAFGDGYRAGTEILGKAKRIAAGGHSNAPYFKMELRRQYLLPALEGLCRIWYGMPDGKNMLGGAWTWEAPGKRVPAGPRCPGDFLAPSRNAFYPRPSKVVENFADEQGRAILAGSAKFVADHRPNTPGLGTVSDAMFKAIPNDAVLARNLIGTMIGAIPPMDGNLRGILLEWLNERTLWRHQAALRDALEDRPASADVAKAIEVLYEPVSQAMCKRPAPDLLYRTALGPATLKASNHSCNDVDVKKRDLVIVSLVSATQRSLRKTPEGEVSIVFGGKRSLAYQPATNPNYPVHACPAQKMAMGAIMGILAALLDAGRIQALPASLIVRVSDWP